MPAPDIHFRAVEPLGSELETRSEALGMPLHRVAQQALLLYFHLLHDTLQGIQLTDQERAALSQALHGVPTEVLLEPHSYWLSWARLDDAKRRGKLADVAPTLTEQLVTKLKAMTPTELAAVADAAARGAL